MYYGLYKGIRDAAWQCLLDNNIHSLPVDVIGIARACGIRVIRNSSVSELAEGENGKSYYDGDNWIIIYDDSLSLEIRRFTVAHELGHIFLGHQLIYARYAGTSEFCKKPKSEQQADMFATRLLCPSCVLWALDLSAARDIIYYCKVPLHVAEIRADRMRELCKRNKFLTSPLENKVYDCFKNYIRLVKN